MIKAFKCQERIVNINGRFIENGPTLIRSPFYDGTVPSRKVKRNAHIEYELLREYNPGNENKNMIIAQCLLSDVNNPKVLYESELLDEKFELSEYNINQYHYGVLKKLMKHKGIGLISLIIYEFTPLTSDDEIRSFPQTKDDVIQHSRVKKFEIEAFIINKDTECITHVSTDTIQLLDSGQFRNLSTAEIMAIDKYQVTLIKDYYAKSDFTKLDSVVICSFLDSSLPAIDTSNILITNILLDEKLDIRDEQAIWKALANNKQLNDLIDNANPVDSMYCIAIYKVTPIN